MRREVLQRQAKLRQQILWPAPSFIPWVFPAVLYLITGIILANTSWPWWMIAIGLSAIIFGLRRFLGLLIMTSLFLPFGFVRHQMWEGAVNPLADYYNQELTLSGYSDGRYLQVEQPFRARLVLSPRDKAKIGQIRVYGTLLEPEAKRNPGGFDYRRYLRHRGVRGQLLIDSILDHELPAVNIKERLRRAVIVGLGARSAGLMQAMTLGIRDDLNDLRSIFAQSGLAHILALSGLHVGIVVAALGLLTANLGRYRYPALMLMVIAFIYLVGISPSILRAGIMTLVVLGSLWQGSGRLQTWPALAFSALISLSLYPAWLFDLSFQLSYLAVAGILTFFEPLSRLMGGQTHHPWWHWRTLIIANIAISVAAQMFTLPLVASTFNSVPIFSPLVNLVAIPLATVLVPLGFAAGLVGLVNTSAAAFINGFTSLLAQLLIATATFGSQLPTLTWGEISASGYLYYALGCTAVILGVRALLRPWRVLLLLCVMMLTASLTSPRSTPELVFLDVGQGDSTLIRLSGRVEILVDGGGSPFSDFDVGAAVVVPALQALDVDELEVVIASHADADHIEGLVSVIDQIPTQQLVMGQRAEGDEDYDALIAAARRNDVEIHYAKRGEIMEIAAARLTFLHPTFEVNAAVNDNSVAFVLSIAGRDRVLFLGDVSAAIEEELAIPDVDVLMVAHHGSKTSTSAYLLAAATPEQVVLSYGRNYYGHPHTEVLSRLESSGAKIYHTFLEGAIRIPLH